MSEIVKVGFTGTSAGMSFEQKQSLNALLNGIGVEEFHHGDCIGADEEAHSIASDLEAIIHIHPPLNPKSRAFCSGNIYPSKAYLARNHDIVDATEILVATPKGFKEILRSGTWATIRYARKKRQTIHIIWPDGEVFTAPVLQPNPPRKPYYG